MEKNPSFWRKKKREREREEKKEEKKREEEIGKTLSQGVEAQ